MFRTRVVALAVSRYSPRSRVGLVHHSLRRPLLATSPLSVASSLTVQRRWQYAQSGKRDQEAFLTQFDPLEVLGLTSDCTIDEIDAAFEERKAYYGANGKRPDPKMVDRVFRAHEILKDPESPYYLKAHSSQTDRQRLQFQLLPKSKRRLIEVQVGVLMFLTLAIGMLTILICFLPVKKTKHAALR